MSDQDDIAALVAAARRGAPGAFARLFRRFAPVVHGVLLGVVGPGEAEDLTQDVFETVLERLGELREDAAFPGWVVSIARRAGIDAARRRTPFTGLEPVLERAGHEAPHDIRLEAQRALEAIRTLPEAYRETLMLRLVEGLSGPEIAALTGMQPGSVRVNLHRGMALLRHALGAATGEDSA